MPVDSTPTPAATPTATPAPTPTTTVPTYPVAQAPPPIVQVPVEEFQRMSQAITRLNQIEESRQREANERATREAEMLAEQGKLKESFSELRTQKEKEVAEEKRKAAEIEERTRHYALERELATAINGYDVLPGTHNQITQLIRSQFSVVPEGSGYSVKTPLQQTPTDYLKEWFTKPEAQHFLKATHQGGVGQHGGGNQPPSTVAPVTPVDASKLNFGQAAILQTLADQKAKQEKEGQSVPAQLNMAVAMGLKPIRKAQ